MMVFPEQNRDHQQRDRGKCDQQAGFPVRVRVGEQAEGRASVFGMGELKKAWDNLNVRIKPDALRHEVLRPAVKQDNDECNQKVEAARGVLGHPKLWLE
jgi:hypothetical protein